LIPVLDLGNLPLANRLLSVEDLSQLDQTEKTEPCWPLDLVRCPQCALVQITETVDPEILFANYNYLSSFSETMVQHARRLVDHVVKHERLDTDSLAVEIASNDGYLLQWYQQHGVPVLGIEPATNIAKLANDRGITTRCEFFGSEVAKKLRGEGIYADTLHAHNAMAHVADLNGFADGIATILSPTGVAIIEFPYLGDFLKATEFDTVYHEHLCYFSLTPLQLLFAKYGLEIVDVVHVPIHGGTARISVAHEGSRIPTDTVQKWLDDESKWVHKEAVYQDFAQRVSKLAEELCKLIMELKGDGARIAVYGASAKGSTLMNFFGIDNQLKYS
jgi:hypothetical protein